MDYEGFLMKNEIPGTSRSQIFRALFLSISDAEGSKMEQSFKNYYRFCCDVTLMLENNTDGAMDLSNFTVLSSRLMIES
jgi:hypothetical protein